MKTTVLVAMVALGLAGCASSKSADGTTAGSTVGPTPVVTVDLGTPAPAPAGATPTVQLVDVATATSLAADPSVIVVDVRTPAEFAEGHISRAIVADIQDPGFGAQIAQLDRSATYLVYCHSGNRSGQATAFMAELGFTNVKDLDGGISAWSAAGAPVVT
jgi:rhodanese-related sulfurtransferase